MKERITYLLPDGETAVNPDHLVVTEDSIELPGFNAAKEWRIALRADELPEPVQAVLKDSHELHLRWTSSVYDDSTTPLFSRIPPGLHAFYTPLKGREVSPELCPMIKYLFGPTVKCDETETAFTKASVLSGRFASSSAYQYHQQIHNMEHFQSTFLRYYCAEYSEACLNAIYDLSRVTSMELDYDAISQSVVVTGTFPPEKQEGIVQKRSPEDRVEVGILNRESATEIEEISLGGFLTVLGEDDRPKPTLFSFPSRHHQVPLPNPESFTYTTEFREPTGLHPTLQLIFNSTSLPAPLPSCSLHTYLTLPSTLFVDRHQLSDPLFLASQNLLALRSLLGATDLEAPEWTTQQWGSAALFSLATPEDKPTNTPLSSNSTWTVSLPLHFRYLPPRLRNDTAFYPTRPVSAYTDSDGKANANTSETRGITTTSIPYPVVFWACPAESGLKMAVNPFDRVNLGYDVLFGPKTMFWHVPPRGATEGGSLSRTEQELTVEVNVPVLDLDETKWVEPGTGVVVLLGFIWVLWSLWSGMKGVGWREVEHNRDTRQK